jgi:hypothetical protein
LFAHISIFKIYGIGKQEWILPAKPDQKPPFLRAFFMGLLHWRASLYLPLKKENLMRSFLITASALCVLPLAGCGSDTQNSQTSQDAFFAALSAHCGKGYTGKLVSTDEVDADMAKSVMQMKVGPCSDSEIRIPFHVDDNRSRTWVITRTESGLRLKHRHGHEDGTEDTVSQYGGDTANLGSATRQEFPVDQFSIDMFKKEGLNASVTNIWAVEITPKIYAYELRRENRHFRVEIDLENPVSDVPDPW